jgi:hypothetical protein
MSPIFERGHPARRQLGIKGLCHQQRASRSHDCGHGRRNFCFLLSEDAGAHWEKIGNPEFGSPVRTLMQDPSHPSIIYLGTGAESVYRLTLEGF